MCNIHIYDQTFSRCSTSELLINKTNLCIFITMFVSCRLIGIMKRGHIFSKICVNFDIFKIHTIFKIHLGPQVLLLILVIWNLYFMLHYVSILDRVGFEKKMFLKISIILLQNLIVILKILWKIGGKIFCDIFQLKWQDELSISMNKCKNK